MAKTILIADDDSTVMKLFHLDIENKDSDIVIHTSATGEDTITSIERVRPDILVLDIRMPKGDGFSVLEHLEKSDIDVPVVILTNYRNEEYLKKSRKYSNVKEYIVKHETRMDRVIKTVGAYLD